MMGTREGGREEVDLLGDCTLRSCGEKGGICYLRFLSNRLGVLFFLLRVIFLVRVLDTFVFSEYNGNTITNLIPPSGGKR